jgi:hypothetical protein
MYLLDTPPRQRGCLGASLPTHAQARPRWPHAATATTPGNRLSLSERNAGAEAAFARMRQAQKGIGEPWLAHAEWDEAAQDGLRRSSVSSREIVARTCACLQARTTRTIAPRARILKTTNPTALPKHLSPQAARPEETALTAVRAAAQLAAYEHATRGVAEG